MRFIMFVLLMVGFSAQGGMIPPSTRFHPANCLQRAVEAAGVTRMVKTAVEIGIVSYLEEASSLFELGKRFAAISRGNFRVFYPDAAVIAQLVESMEALHLRQTSGFFVGMRYPVVRLVSRPIESFELQLYTSEIYRESMKRNLAAVRGHDYAVYTVKHVDGSRSYIVAFRESDEAAPHIADRTDDRPLFNLFVYSNGPDQKPDAMLYAGHQIGREGARSEVDAEVMLRELEQKIQTGDLLPAK